MPEKPSRSRRPPQEEKRFSCERDRVNVYGENDKASRKAIPAFKARSNRTMRRASGQHLGQLAIDVADERADTALAEATFDGLHPKKRKMRDRSLGLALELRGDRVAGAPRRAAVRAEVGELSQYPWFRERAGRSNND